MRLTRRHVLATFAAVSAAGAVGAGGLAWRWWDRSPMAGLRVLSDDEHAFAQALAEAWMPPGGEPALSGAEAQLGAFLDDTLAAMTPFNQKMLKLLLQALDDYPRLTRFSSFQALSIADRQAVLTSWLNNDNHLIRAAISAVVVLMSIGWTTHPEVTPHLRPSMNCWYGR